MIAVSHRLKITFSYEQHTLVSMKDVTVANGYLRLLRQDASATKSTMKHCSYKLPWNRRQTVRWLL